MRAAVDRRRYCYYHLLAATRAAKALLFITIYYLETFIKRHLSGLKTYSKALAI